MEITDAGLEFVPSEGTTPGKVLATMKIKNTGISYPSLKPVMRILKAQDKHWRMITLNTFSEQGIIPGVELNLKSDIGKSLPKGRYLLEAVLYVEGRRIGKGCELSKEIDFDGDPLITHDAADVPLDVEPRELFMEINPGSTRFASISIHNATEEKIEIQPVLDIPVPFKGYTGKDNKIIAEERTCLKWISCDVDKLNLTSYQARNLRLGVTMPENATEYPCYYATLGLKVLYPDGQSGGTTWINIAVGSKNVPVNTDIQCISIKLAEFDREKSEYMVSADFGNNGDWHIEPSKVLAAVAKAGEYGRTTSMLSSDTYGMLLPYETRTYNGTLNLSTVDPNIYNLEVKMEYPPTQTVRKQIQIRVNKVGDKRVPEILEQNVKSNNLIEVKW